MRTRISLAVVTCLAIAVALAACGEKLPEDPGLLADDLGIGLWLGQPAAAAREVSPPSETSILVVSGEEYAGNNPYDEREEGTDLLVATYNAGTEQLDPKGLAVTDPVLNIKCFLRSEGDSSITLFGQDATTLTPELLVNLLGDPFSRIESNDGAIHLTFSFQSDQLSDRNIFATFSHQSTGRCYAFELGLSLIQ